MVDDEAAAPGCREGELNRTADGIECRLLSEPTEQRPSAPRVQPSAQALWHHAGDLAPWLKRRLSLTDL